MLDNTITALNDRVQSRLRFTAEDLSANRAGRLSDAQQVLVRSKQRSYVRNGGIALAVMWAIFTALLIVSVISEGAKPQDLAVLPFVIAGMTLIFAAVGVGSRIHARELLRGQIRMVEGQAVTKRAKYTTRYGRGISYVLRIGRQKFLMTSERELDAFETGAHYRVYYIWYTPLHILLSAEALGAAKPSEK